MLRLGALLLICGAAGSCSREPAPRWISLAQGFRPAADVEGSWAAPFQGNLRLSIARAQADEHGVWIRAEIARGDWRKSEHFPDVWQLLRPIAGEGTPVDGPPQQLAGEGLAFTYFPFSRETLREPESVPVGSFCGYLDQLYLRLETGVEPPGELVYSVFVERGVPRDGAWRVGLGAHRCDGLPVWSGHSEEVAVDVPPNSALRFTTLARASSARGLGAAKLTFRVRANGAELLRHEQAVSDVSTVDRHLVDLSAHAGERVRLTFSTDGPAALAAFLTPVVGPLEIGRSGARPWGAARPDLVLFLADTFRADNLQFYGGERGVTPRLDELVERSLAFSRAWAPSSWTLPSQASMMCALLPYQHGAIRSLTALPQEALTVAELLERAGYRTEAVTDAAFLSHRFAMDQGFQWFDELPEDKRDVTQEDSFEATLRRVDERLAADDGRPLFLYVQTYRVHFPYVVSERTRREYGDRLGLELHWKELEAALRRESWTPGGPIPDRLQPLADALRELYLGGVVDFDRSFGSWLSRHEAGGFFENAVLLFTSDHGEAFGEHSDLYHGTGVWESQIRVPLFLFGAGLEPRVAPHAATLLDLPRTFAQLAGVEPAASWGGESLLELDRDRAVYSFEASVYETAAQTVIEGGHKLILADDETALRDRRVREAYDLRTDRRELQNLVESEPAWIEDLAARRFPELIAVRRRILPESEVQLSVDDLDELAKLGYTGEEN